VKIMPVASKTP
jgi:hypothetical protein